MSTLKQDTPVIIILLLLLFLFLLVLVLLLLFITYILYITIEIIHYTAHTLFVLPLSLSSVICGYIHTSTILNLYVANLFQMQQLISQSKQTKTIII